MTRFALILTFTTLAFFTASVKNGSAVNLSASCKGAVTWQVASHSIGRTVTVEGVAVGAKFVHWKSGKGTMTFLDMGGKYPHSKFTVVVWNMNVAAVAGHKFCARGPVTIYNGKPELSADHFQAVL